MTVTEFISLNNEQRYILWLVMGIKVASYETGLFQYALYQLESFYVELRLFKLFPDVVNMYILTDEKWPEPYLKRIDISELVE